MKRVFSSFVLASLLLPMVGCSSSPLMPNVMNEAPNLFTSLQPNSGQPAFNTFAASSRLIQTHFVQAYRPLVAQNDPITRKDTNGPAQALIRWIDSARKTLDGAFYDIGSPDVVNAFLRAKKRGVKVRLITDNENMTEKDTGPTGPRRALLVQLEQAGIPVLDDARSGLMHDKFVIVDSRVIWTGSTNITDSSLFHHNNNALSVQSPEMVANFQSEFERMFTQHIFGPNPPRQIPFPIVKVGSATIETYFSPKGGGQEAVMKTLQSAQKNISFMTFSFTDPDVGNMIAEKAQAKVKVQGVFDRCLGSSRYSLYDRFRKTNINALIDGNEALLHHKIILVDQTVVTGSNNYSANSEGSNNENILIIRGDKNVTDAYYQEFDRIMHAAQVNHAPRGTCPGDKPPVVPGQPPVEDAEN